MSHWVGAKEQKLLERVRKLCLAFPETTERLSHGEPCFYVRDKHTFVMCMEVGKGGWIGMRIDIKPDWKQIAALIDEAYYTVAEARKRRR